MGNGRKILLLLLTALLVLGIALTAAAEKPAAEAEPGETVIGYFRKDRSIRPKTEATMEILGNVPAFTVMEMETVKKGWGQYTSPEGITGYIYYQDIQPVPVPEPCGERIVYCEEQQMLRSLPEFSQKDPRRVEPFEMLTVDGTYRGYMHVRTTGGEEGYIEGRLLTDADFEPEAISSVRFCAGAETGALAMPLKGAEKLMTVSPGIIYEASEGQGDYYVLRTAEGTPAYVWKGAVRLLQAVGPESMTFFRKPRITGSRGDEASEDVFSQARVRTDTALRDGRGSREPLKAGDRVYVYALYGGFYGVSHGQSFGYVKQEDLEIQDRETAAEAIARMDLSGATIEKNEFLDAAFSLLEEGNSFLLRYNAITGSDIQPLFSLGVPYFWGGRGYNILTERWPEYTTREAWQDSINYYRKGTTYIYGFDCIGLVKTVYKLAGHEIRGTVGDLISDQICEAGQHIWCSGKHPIPEDWNQVAEKLEIGDLLWVKHPGVHALIYIGTLRDYGYTEEQLPAMAGMLDYPLMIHCSRNPYCYFRFRNLLASQEKGRLAAATPPDGGVSICILGPDEEEAEMHIAFLDGIDDCFEVEGTCVTISSFKRVTSYFFYRDTPPAPETTEESSSAEPLAEETSSAEPLPQETPSAKPLAKESPSAEPRSTETPLAEPLPEERKEDSPLP